ncbi:MAG: hypothetical protein ACR2NU_02585, partial [Aeoliella sp.]
MSNFLFLFTPPSRCVWSSLLPLVVMMGACTCAPPSLAQGGYKNDPVDASMRKYGTSAKRFAKAPAADAQAKTNFGNY